MENLDGLVINMRSWFNKNLKNSLKFHKPALWIIIGVFGGLFTYVFSKLMLIKPDGLYIGQANAWSDWVVHISITNIFANKHLHEWFLYHPFFAHSKLTYGFLVHLITALLMRIGFRIDTAFFAVSVLLLFTFLFGLYFLYYQLSHSQKQSILGIFIFFTSSGMGIFRFIKTLKLNEILHPAMDYSSYVEYQWLAGNIPAAMLIPQRAFFLGVTIGVWVLNLLLWGIQKNKKKEIKLQKKLFIVAGVLAGILPISHMHSFIAIIIVTGTICFFNKTKFRQLLYYVIPAFIISSLLYLYFIHGGIQIDNFMTIQVGWTSPKTVLGWIKMWLQLWGTFLPLVIFAFLYFKKNNLQRKNFSFFLGFVLVFILANVIVFQPTQWDNTKLFAWVYLGLSILVARLLAFIFKKTLLLKLATIILIVTLSATGFVELIRIFNFENNTHMLSSNTEILFAKQIANNTKTDAIFLTSTIHNHPIPLWANRPIFLGYLGWIRNFGFDHTIRSQQTHKIFGGNPEANQIIIENKISYIYLGPSEQVEFLIDYQYLNQFPVVFQNKDTTVYDTRQLWQ